MVRLPIEENCVGCGNCGEVAEAAALCPSFYRARIIDNPSAWDRFVNRVRGRDRLARTAADGRTHRFRVRQPVTEVPIGRAGFAGSRRISIAILAMGGQGGGVLADWVVALAEGQGWTGSSAARLRTRRAWRATRC
jgi:hypothetical protein